MSENPLAKYFRMPGLNVTLPTNGAFLPKGSLELTVDGAVPVLPMRAADELLLKNPDALLSGYAIEQMLASCVPSIKTPRLISMPDLDVLLLAVRAATYGDTMEVQATCPKCSHPNTFDCHLPTFLQSTTAIPEDTTVRLSDDIVVYLRPYNFADTTALSLAVYQETRKQQAIELDEETTESQRIAQQNASIQHFTNLQTQLMAGCVIEVMTPEGPVSDREFIADFMSNIERGWATKMENKLRELNDVGIDKSVDVKCSVPTCGTEWKTSIEFDPASFFDSGS